MYIMYYNQTRIDVSVKMSDANRRITFLDLFRLNKIVLNVIIVDDTHSKKVIPRTYHLHLISR
jgi:hypothetical protein